MEMLELKEMLGMALLAKESGCVKVQLDVDVAIELLELTIKLKEEVKSNE